MQMSQGSEDGGGGGGGADVERVSSLPPFNFLPVNDALRWTPSVVVSAEADASGELGRAIAVLREAVTGEASWGALVCIALEDLADVMRQAHPDTPDAMARVTRLLESITSPTAAARHLCNWRHCQRVYAAREDREFWNQLLRDSTYHNRVIGFSMSMLMFLATEYDTIAAGWVATENRHALWKEVYLCGYSLPAVILYIGDILAEIRRSNGGDVSAPIFHPKAQTIYEQQLQRRLGRVGVIADVADEAPPHNHATALVVYDTEAQVPSSQQQLNESEHKEVAPHVAEEVKEPSERDDLQKQQQRSQAESPQQPPPPDTPPDPDAMTDDAHEVSTVQVGGTSRQKRILTRNRPDEDEHKNSLHVSRSSKRRRKSAASSIDEVKDNDQMQQGEDDAGADADQAQQQQQHASVDDDAPVVEYLFSVAEALEPIALTRPLETAFPFDPSVRAHMRKFGIAVITPAFGDQLSLLQSLEPRALETKSYGHAYRMSLGCFNQQQEVDQAELQAAIDAEAAVHPPAPSSEQVLAFLEQQWTHMCESDEPNLPRLESTESRIYVKDVAAQQDARSDDTDEDAAPRISFLPKFDRAHAELMQQLQDVEDDQEQQQEAEAEEGEDTLASDDPETRRYLRTAKLRLDSLSVACASAYKRRGGSSRSSPPVAYHFHPLYQDEISLHPESLARLSPDHFAGIENAFAYLKRFFQFFNLHLEQMLLAFLHHQLCGESLWIVIPHSERDKLAGAIAEMVETRARWMQRHRGGDAAVAALDQGVTACLSRVAFHAKNLFPPLSLLAKHDVRYYRVTLKAGQILTAHGGFAHFGFNTSKSETSSLASNMLTEEWFLTGGPEFLVRHFQWVQQMQAMDEQHQHPSLDSMLQARGLTTAQLAGALNVCPPAYACSLLRGMQADLRLHALGRDEECVGTYAMSIAQTQAVLVQLTRARALLHQVRPFMRKYYVDPDSDMFQVCECSESERGESPHSPIDDAPAPMDEEDDADTQIQSAQVRRRHASARSKRLPSSPDEEEKSGAPATGAKPSADAAQRPSPLQRKLDTYLASLRRLRHAPSDAPVTSAQYTRISTDLMRCWYASVSLALGVDTFWRIHQAIQDAVAAVPDIGVATALGFPGAHAAGADLAQLKRSFLHSADFEAARWGSDMEMHLLSYAYRGALRFLVYRERLAEPTSYRYSGTDAQPTALVEIALHWCPSRSRQRERRAPEPNHYNLLQYTVAGQLQPFWWLAAETEAHKETRHEHLREAAREAVTLHA